MDLNLTKHELVEFIKKKDFFPAEFKRFYKNFDILGSPICDAEYCTKHITKHVKGNLKHTLADRQECSGISLPY